jgi:2-polyprenyl-6-methoxyphenol hydroxylase-like FAD-dependent oxidoreductase
VCLIGDGAHRSTPHLSARAGMAFEDTYVLSNLLGGVEDQER